MVASEPSWRASFRGFEPADEFADVDLYWVLRSLRPEKADGVRMLTLPAGGKNLSLAQRRLARAK